MAGQQTKHDAVEGTSLSAQKGWQMAARLGTAPRQSRGKRTVWRDLEDHHAMMQGLHLRSLFADDPTRGERMAAEAAGVYLGYSKNRINDETLKLLTALAKQPGPPGPITALSPA